MKTYNFTEDNLKECAVINKDAGIICGYRCPFGRICGRMYDDDHNADDADELEDLLNEFNAVSNVLLVADIKYDGDIVDELLDS